MKFLLIRALLLGLLAVPCALPADAQPQDAGAARLQGLNVFLDCEQDGCDFDYLRTEIPFVNYVRNREDADVHVLVTTQPTGGGGAAYTVDFIGQQAFVGLDDTLSFAAPATATDAEVRAGLARVLQAGLLRYISRTPLLDRIRIRYDAPAGPQTAAQPLAPDDPWDFWVFEARLRGDGEGEERFQSIDLFGIVEASRTTAQWKLLGALYGSHATERYELEDRTERNVQEGFGGHLLVVKSLNRHWSAGARASGDHNTQSNYDLSAYVAPALEYNVFPYTQSTRKLFTFRYILGLTYFNYADTTLFNRLEQTLVRQSLQSELAVTQRWGTAAFTFEGTSFLYDPEKYSLRAGGELAMRLFRGFAVEVAADVRFLRDQINLEKGDASETDVLLQRRELATNWRYSFGFGISYTFGSKFNNIVNPRFSAGPFF